MVLLTEESFSPKNVHNIIRYALQNEYGEDADLDGISTIRTGKESSNC